MFNSVYKRCNSNDANAWRDAGSGELHATFFDSPSNGSHALPPTAQTVAQSVAPPMSSRWRNGGMTWRAPSALAKCPLTLNVHPRPPVHPHIRHVGVFMPPMKQFP